jgi:hypothetical protein
MAFVLLNGPRRAAARRTRAALLVLSLVASAVAAAQAPAAPPPCAGAGNAVGAPVNPDQVAAFVRTITPSSRFDGHSVARWRTPLCFDVAGLPANEAGFVAARLSQIASCAGAPLRTQGCSADNANFHVVFTLNADQAAEQWYGRHLRIFNRNASQAQIDRFVHPSNPAPVRVWHDALPYGRDGFPLIPLDPTSTNEPIPHVNFQYDGGSRLSSEAVLGLDFALVLIDGRRTNGASLGQLADYAAMAGLADLNLQATLGDAPTILQLFYGPPSSGVAALSSWDQAFLGALYHSEQSSRSVRTQIADTMVRNISP